MSHSTENLSQNQPPPHYTVDDITRQDQQAQCVSCRTEPRIIGNMDRNIIPMFYRLYSERSSVYNASVFIAGDVGVGKSCLMSSYNGIKSVTTPDFFNGNECYIKMRGLYDVPFLLKILHVGGFVEGLALRDMLPIPDDIILLCFAMDNPISLFNARDKWAPKLKHHMYSRKVPIILVGTKCDVGESFIKPGLAEMVAKEIGAISYIKCSAKENYDVLTVFNLALHHLHIEWRSGLAKVFEKSLLPYVFEEQAGKTSATLFGDSGKSEEAPPYSEVATGETAVKRYQTKPTFDAEKKKKKDTCAIV